MEKTQYLYGFLLLFVSLFACRQDSRARFCLEEAERLMESRPDSSLSLLESLCSPEKLPSEDYVTWCLLLTQARDKNYLEHTSDSVIEVAVRYFEKRNEPHRMAQAYYCRGRVLSDLNLSEEALEAYLKAKEQAGQTADYNLQARINNHLGGLHWKNMNNRESLSYYQEAHRVYAFLSDTAGMVNTLCNIGKCLQGMNRLDSASVYYGKALDLTEEGNLQSQKGTVLTSLGNISMEQGDYVTALARYQGALRSTKKSKYLDTRYHNLGKAYQLLGQADSALFYLEKIVGSENLFTRCNAHRLLYQLAKERGAHDSAFVHNETYWQLRDSIEHLYRPHELEQVKALYNKERLQNRHDRQMREAEIRQLVWVVLFLASLVVGMFIYSYFNKKLALQRARNQEILNLLEENRRQLAVKNQELDTQNARLEAVQQSLSKLWEEKDCLEKKREEQVSRLEEDNRKQEAAHERELEELESRIKSATDEKEALLHEKVALIHQKDMLLDQQDVQLKAMLKAGKQYEEQIEKLVSERQKTRQEMDALRLEIDTLRSESEARLQQEMKSREDYQAQYKMYETWQKELVTQNRCLSRVHKQLVLSVWKEPDWESFMENFNRIYPGFYDHLVADFDLTQREIRIVCLTKLGIKTGKVACVFGLGEDMIRRIKSDIRKRCFPTSTAHSLDQIIKRWY